MMKRKKLVKIFLFLILTLPFLKACDNPDEEIAPELLNKSEANKYILIDVRTPAEHAEERIPDSKLIPINSENFKAQINKLPKEEEIVVYCKSGGRSVEAVKKFKEEGFKNVYSLEGGIENWKASGYSVEK